MAESIVNEAPVVVTEEALIDVHPGLWQAQSLCRLLYDFVENGPEDSEDEQFSLDIKNTAKTIEGLIEQAHYALNALEKVAIMSKVPREGGVQ